MDNETIIRKTIVKENLICKMVVESTSNDEEYIAIATMSTVDNEQDIFLSSGADLSYIEKNKVLFLDHNYDSRSVVGYIRSFSKYPSKTDHKAWAVRFGLLDNDIGQTIKKIIHETGSFGVSIGALATDAGPLTTEERKLYDPDGKAKRIVRKWKWVELSLTPIPAHSDARAYKAEDFDKVAKMVANKQLTSEEIEKIGLRLTNKKSIVVSGNNVITINKPIVEVI